MKKMMIHGQISESVRLALLLALSGGYMDAYTYMCRGEVFANAQTGNMILFGVNLAEGKIIAALSYLLPVLMFAAGILLADRIRLVTDRFVLHWRQLSVLAEAAILFAVAFIPQQYNMAANALVSFACGIQVESFRKVRGNAMATTMCIGNLRSAMSCLHGYIETGDKGKRYSAAIYGGVIAVFVTGAVLGHFGVKFFAEYAIFAASIILMCAFALMFAEND